MKLLQQFDDILSYQRIFLRLIGCDFWKKNYQLANSITIFLLSNATFYYIVNSYSMYKFSKDLVPFAYCLVTLGVGIQGADKLRVYLFNYDNILKYHNALVKFHKDNEKLPLELQKEVSNELKLLNIIVKIVNIIYILGGGFIIIFPFLLMKYTNDDKLLMYGFVLPGINHETSPGYEINFFYQLIQTYVICIGTNISDAHYAWLLFHSRMQLHVIIGELKNLNDFIINGGNILEQSCILNGIIEKHVLLTIYMRNLERHFSNHLFLYIITASFQVILTVFVLMTTTWFSGIPVFIQGEFQLLLVCLLGTVFSMKCDELEREIYNVEWYSMELSERKKFLLFLQMAQNPIEPSFGGLGYLNLNTFLLVNKSIYSYLMVFLNFV